jgi:hypothetical protein
MEDRAQPQDGHANLSRRPHFDALLKKYLIFCLARSITLGLGRLSQDAARRNLGEPYRWIIRDLKRHCCDKLGYLIWPKARTVSRVSQPFACLTA